MNTIRLAPRAGAPPNVKRAANSEERATQTQSWAALVSKMIWPMPPPRKPAKHLQYG